MRRIIALLLLLCVGVTSVCQITGSSENGLSPNLNDADIPSSSLSIGVNTFTGEFQNSYNFGRVESYGTASFDISMVQSSRHSIGSTPSVIQGIPYGVGWRVNLPTITMKCEAFTKYTRQEVYQQGSGFISRNGTAAPCSETRLYESSGECEDLEKESATYWFEPEINIPGVYTGKVVLTELSQSGNLTKLTFKPHIFSSPLTIEMKLSGSTAEWKVILPSGIVYYFENNTLVNFRNPANQRAEVACLPADRNQSSDLGKQIFPKPQYLTWYCDRIYNPLILDDEIFFEYEKYGKFNFYKHLNQPEISKQIAYSTKTNGARNVQAGGELDPCKPESVIAAPFKDIIIKRIRSSKNTFEFEYESQDNQYDGPNNRFADRFQLNVQSYDNMYNMIEVERFGQENGGTSFQEWKRYNHARKNEFLPSQTRPSVTNPYIARNYPGAPGDTYIRELIGNQSQDIYSPNFDHGFLESPKLFSGGSPKIVPGDIYEIRTKLNTSDPGAQKAALYDINIVTGDPEESTTFTSLIGVEQYTRERKHTVFSTFSRMIKWFNMGNVCGSGTPQYFRAQTTSDFFTMPNYDFSQSNGYDGFFVQIGPANADVMYDILPNQMCDARVGPVIVGQPNQENVCLAYNNFSQRFIDCNSPWGTLSGDDINRNFGIGVPWYNTLQFYGSYNYNLEYIQNNNCSYQADRFWWNWPYSQAGCDYPNVPTRTYNTELTEVGLYRYTKNPYMLVGVKEFQSTDLTNHCDLIECLAKRNEYNHCGLVNSYELNYEQELTDLTIKKFGGNNTFYNGVLNYLLASISKTTLDGSVPSKQPSVYYEYESVVSPLSGIVPLVDYESFRIKKIIDEYGKENELEYYTQDGLTTREVPFNSGVPKMVGDPDDSFVQVLINRVHKVTTNSSRGNVETEYIYQQPFHINDYSLDPDILKRCNEKITNLENGTAKCIVKGPALVGSVNRPEKIIEYHTDVLKWGKEKSIEQYDDNNFKVSEMNYEYDERLVFESPVYKVQFDDPAYYYPYYQYVVDPSRPVHAGLDEISLRAYDANLKAWSGGLSNLTTSLEMPSIHGNGSVWLGTEFYDKQNDHNPYYYKSFFVAPVKKITRTYEENCVVPVIESPTVEFLELIEEYEYYSANLDGTTSSLGYQKLMGTGAPYDLFFEPSWLLFSKKVYSSDMPGVESEQQNFYYGDLKHMYALVIPYSQVVGSYQWFAAEVEDKHAYGVPYQKRLVKRHPNGVDHQSSEYYIYEKELPIIRDNTGLTQTISECPNNDYPCDTGEELTLENEPDNSYYLLHEIFRKSGSGLGDLMTFNVHNGTEAFLEQVYLYKRFHEYHETGQPALVEDEKGLFTKYDFQRDRILYKVACPNGNTKDAGFFTALKGKPKSITKGYSLPDELTTTLSYDPTGRVEDVIDPNGTKMTYEYDAYGILNKKLRNDEVISEYDWSLYSTNLNEYNNNPPINRSIKARAQKNWSSERVYFDATKSNLIKSYSDVNRTVVAMENDDDMQFDHLLDEYGRVGLRINPKDYASGITPKVTQVGDLLNPDWIETQYDRAPRTRPLYESPYGESVIDFGKRNYKKYFYCIYLKGDIESELASLGYTIGSDYLVAQKYFHVQIQDEDDKSIRQFMDPLGNVVLTIADNQIPTFYKYGPQGKVIETQNAKGQITTYEYNQLGLLHKTNSPDKGELQFAYNRSGSVIGEMNAQLERRVNTYDEFNRRTSQQRLSVPWELYNLFDNKGLPWVTDPGFDVSSTPWKTKEKEWFYNSHNTALNSTIHVYTRLNLYTHRSRAKGRLVQTISYDVFGSPVEYNFKGYNTKGFVSFENNQFNPVGITTGAKGIYMTTDYQGFDRQGNAQVQNMDWGNNGLDFQIFKVFDERGRISQVYGNYLNEGSGGHLFAEYDYDDKINKVIEKRYFGSPYTECGYPQVCEDIQINTFDYTYDHRHRLTRKKDNLFDYHMYYDDQVHPTHPDEIFTDGMGEPIQNYNGNINGISSHYRFLNVDFVPQIFRGDRTDYIYRYDNLNRLVEADAFVHDAQNAWAINPTQTSKIPDIGDVSYEYDAIGNLTRMYRGELFANGCINSSGQYSYTYGAGNNRLMDFTKPTSYSCSGNTGIQSFPFTYDANGNINSNSLRENAVTFYMRTNFPRQYYQPSMNRNVHYLYSTDDQRVYKDVKNFGVSPVNSEYYSLIGGGELASVYNYADESVTWYIYGNERVAKVKHDFRICPPSGDGGGEGGEGPAGEGPEGLELQPDGGLVWNSFVHPVIQGHQIESGVLDMTNAYNVSLISAVSMLEDSITPDSQVFFNLPKDLHLVEIGGEEKVYWADDLPSSGITDNIDVKTISSLFEPIKAYDLDSNEVWVNLNDMLNIQFPDPITAPSNDGDEGGGNGGEGGGEEVPEIKPPHGEYFIYDHLGNTRVVFAPLCIADHGEAPVGVRSDLLHVIDYYPYGKILREYVKNEAVKFYTTHHERDEESGLDYRGARYYDSDVCRFLSVDPLAHERSWVTPYNYVQNNPILRIDPNGALDSLYTVDVETGEYTNVGLDGGNEFDVIIPIRNNDDGTQVVVGEAFVDDGVGFDDPQRNNPFYASSGQLGTLDGADDPIFNAITLGMGGAIKGGQAVEGINMASILPRVPAGKSFYDVVRGRVVKGGQWMRKKLDGYLELDPKTLRPPTTTSRGKPFSPKVVPQAKSRWAKFMELFGNFDDPRY